MKKKLSSWLFLVCFIFTSIFTLTACEHGKICTHTYELVRLSTDTVSDIQKPAIYTCSECQHTKIQEVSYKEIGLPSIDFIGSLDGISKENELKISIKYSSNEQTFECDAKIKV